MKKIKVAFFAEIMVSDFDGASRTMFQLIDRIDPKRFEFLFICGTGPDQVAGFKCLKVPSVNFPVNKKYKLALPGLAKKYIKKKIEKFNPDVIHIATPSLLGHYALKYAHKHDIRVMSIYHTHFISYISYYFKHLPFLISPIRNNITDVQKKFYNKCDTVYVPATSIVDELLKIGIDKSRLKIWKRGVDTQLFSPEKNDAAYMKELTGNDRPTVLFASRLVWEKNLETLIEIYKGIQREKLGYNFVVAGDGDAKKSCELSMPMAIFTGELDHQKLSVLYASSSVFVFPSDTETFGNVVLEAMASGLPCVISDTGGSADFIEEGVNGYKCDVNEAGAYVEKIKQIIEDTKLHVALSDQARQFSKSYDWDKLADIYFDDLAKLSSPKGF